jgi:hypothetical protein
MFWEDMKETDSGWHGGLRLPGVPEREIIDVDFKSVPSAQSGLDAARNDADLEIVPNQTIVRGFLRFRMNPEPSRPGWTRIEHDREITLAHGLADYEVPTLTYWTKSEIACLALF